MSNKLREKKKKVYCDICARYIFCNENSRDTFALRSHEVWSKEHQRRSEQLGLSLQSGLDCSSNQPDMESVVSDDHSILEQKRKILRVAIDDVQSFRSDENHIGNSEIGNLENWGGQSVYWNAMSPVSLEPRVANVVAALHGCSSLIESDDLIDSSECNDDDEKTSWSASSNHISHRRVCIVICKTLHMTLLSLMVIMMVFQEVKMSLKIWSIYQLRILSYFLHVGLKCANTNAKTMI